MAAQKKDIDRTKGVKKTKAISKTIVIIAGVMFCLVIVGFFAFYWQHRTSQQNDCNFVGWKANLGIDTELLIGRLNKAQAKLSIWGSEIRELDVLLKDYGAKFETACLDRKAGRINEVQYQCNRENMARALDSIRSLDTILVSINKLKDPKGQALVAREALRNFQQLARDQYKRNCTSSISVNPKHLHFQDHFPELSIQIANSGNNEFHYTIEELPSGFAPMPMSGQVAIGHTVSVAIQRRLHSIANLRAAGFYVRNNFNDRVYIGLDATEDSVPPSNEGGDPICGQDCATATIPRGGRSVYILH